MCPQYRRVDVDIYLTPQQSNTGELQDTVTISDKHILSSWGHTLLFRMLERVYRTCCTEPLTNYYLVGRTSTLLEVAIILIYFNQSSIDTKCHFYLLYLSLLSFIVILRC